MRSQATVIMGSYKLPYYRSSDHSRKPKARVVAHGMRRFSGNETPAWHTTHPNHGHMTRVIRDRVRRRRISMPCLSHRTEALLSAGQLIIRSHHVEHGRFEQKTTRTSPSCIRRFPRLTLVLNLTTSRIIRTRVCAFKLAYRHSSQACFWEAR